MSFNSFYKAYSDLLAGQYPLARELIEDAALDRLISPHRIQLPRKIVEQVAAAVKALSRLTHKSSYQNILSDFPDWLKSPQLPRQSPLMAYDFHTTEDGRCYLVEINTNASAFLLSELVYRAHAIPTRRFKMRRTPGAKGPCARRHS